MEDAAVALVEGSTPLPSTSSPPRGGMNIPADSSSSRDAPSDPDAKGSDTVLPPALSSPSQSDSESGKEQEASGLAAPLASGPSSPRSAQPSSSSASQAAPPQLLHALSALQGEHDRLRKALTEKERALGARTAEAESLREMNRSLQSEIAKGKGDNLDQLRREFSKRLAAYEDKIKELRREVDRRKEKSSDQVALAAMKDQLLAKDEQIAQILSEGETLSKRQLQLESAVKRLRAEAKENDGTIRDLKEKVSGLEHKLQSSKAKAKSLEQSEKSANEGMRTAQSSLEQVNRKLTDATREVEVLKSTLAKKEDLLERATAQAAEGAQAQPLLLQQVRRELAEESAEALRKAEQRTARERSSAQERESELLQKIVELQEELARSGSEAEHTEESLRRELSELRLRCAEMESAADLLKVESLKVSGPLMQEIADLRASCRLKADELDAERERVIAMAASRKAEVDDLKMSQDDLNVALKSAQSSLASAEAVNRAVSDEMLGVRAQLSKSRAQAAAFEAQCAAVRQLLENAAEQRKAAEQQWEDALEAQRERGESTLELLRQAGRARAEREAVIASLQAELEQERSRVVSAEAEFPPERAFVGGLPSVGEAERLREDARASSQHAKELQAQLDVAFDQKHRLEEALASAEEMRVSLEKQCERLPVAERELAELVERHKVVLEMLGEKDERLEELGADLQDVKEIFRQQTLELLSELEAVKSSKL